MKDGELEMYVNHADIAIGATSEVDIRLQLGRAAAVASESHVLVKVRAQIAPISVSFWSSAEVRVGTLVHAGVLSFPDAYVCVTDVEGLTRLTRRIASPGDHFVSVYVDDPGRASRIFVRFGDDDLSNSIATPNYTFGSAVPTGSAAHTSSGALEWVLSEYDAPRERLAEAIRILSEAAYSSDVQFAYDIKKIVEWLRWLGPRVSFEASSTAGTMLKHEVEQLVGKVERDVIVELTDRIMRSALG